MAWKDITGRSFADSMTVTHAAIKDLDDLNDLIDGPRAEAHLMDIHGQTSWRESMPPLFMFKALLLQVWYDLTPLVPPNFAVSIF